MPQCDETRVSDRSPVLADFEAVTATAICPLDSVSRGDSCICDYTLCEKPSCDRVLNVIGNFTDNPGFCCPVYSCDPCSLEDIDAGNCTCPTAASIDKVTRKCECIDPEKSLIDGVCKCDQRRCPLNYTCDDNSVPVKESSECCTTIKCKTCPPDSHSSSLIIGESKDVEPKCVCYQCNKPECPGTLVLKRKGRNFPEACCDLYECVMRTCMDNDTVYSDGDVWFSPERGNCQCQNGVSLCSTDALVLPDETQLQPCTYDGKIYSHLSTWEQDACTTCTCYDSIPKCIAHMCGVNMSEVKTPTCPPMENCRKDCEQGYKVNRHGCEICRCRITKIKLVQLERVMDKKRLSELDVVNIINHHFEEETTTTPKSDIVECDYWKLEYILFGVLIIIIATALITVWIVRYSDLGVKEMDTCKLQRTSSLDPITETTKLNLSGK